MNKFPAYLRAITLPVLAAPAWCVGLVSAAMRDGFENGAAAWRAFATLVVGIVNGWKPSEVKPPVITWDGDAKSPIRIDIAVNHEKHDVLWDAFIGAFALSISPRFMSGMPNVVGRAVVLAARRYAEGGVAGTSFEVALLTIETTPVA